MRKRFFRTSLFPILLSLMILCGCKKENENPAWQLTVSTDFGRQPQWSPDGSQIIFGEDTPGKHGIWIWDLSDDPELISDSLPPHNWDYKWSPNSNLIAFSSPGGENSPQHGVWIAESQTRNLRKLSAEGYNVTWYYDGSAIAAEFDESGSGLNGIYRISLEDEPEISFVTYGKKPLCSPVSNKIAYIDQIVDGVVWLGDDNGNRQPISERGVVQWRWSANGEKLFWIQDNYNRARLSGKLWQFIEPDSTLLIKSNVSFPAPNFEGSYIAYLKQSSSMWTGLSVHNLETGEVNIADDVFNPDFDPTGDRIAVNADGGGIRVYERMR